MGNASKTSCPKGHEYTPANTYIEQDEDGPRRHCRACRREVDKDRRPAAWWREYRQRRRAARDAQKPPPPTSTDEKACQRCERVLSRSEFWRRACAVDGLQPWCKACALTRKRQHRLSLTPEKLNLERAKHRRRLLAMRRRSRDFVRGVRTAARCAQCGAQPVEFHCVDHREEPRQRIAVMAAQGRSIASIKKELARCTPLCRPCHAAEDKRLGRTRRRP